MSGLWIIIKYVIGNRVPYVSLFDNEQKVYQEGKKAELDKKTKTIRIIKVKEHTTPCNYIHIFADTAYGYYYVATSSRYLHQLDVEWYRSYGSYTWNCYDGWHWLFRRTKDNKLVQDECLDVLLAHVIDFIYE